MNARTTVRALTTARLVAAATVAGSAATTATGATAGEGTQAGVMEFTEVHVRATGVNVRSHPAGTPAFEQRQKQGELITDSGYRSRWWTCLESPSGRWGWVDNVYITGDEHLAHVSDCEN